MRNPNRPVDEPADGKKRTAPYSYGGAHSTVSQSRLLALLAADGDLTPADRIVIMYYLAQSPGHGEPVKVSSAEIAKYLGINASVLSRIIRKLRERRILLERGKIANTTFYALSPYIGGRGSGFSQRQAIQSCNPPEMPNHDIKPAHIPRERSA